ncbi:MAG: Periplasmic (NiFeSe) hydrogenase small subunit [Syntrophomonadaceae bacterium]|nr:Periplasmic (NiFeSe) hydrogenase small subunit [Bacillota bacterium]
MRQIYDKYLRNRKTNLEPQGILSYFLQEEQLLLTRRRFLQFCLHSTASISLAQLLLLEFAEALRLLPGGKPPVLWLEGTSCTGDTISLDNSADPALRIVLEEIIDLRFSPLLMWAQNQEALDILFDTMEKHRDQFILVVEGGIPMGMPEAVIIGERIGKLHQFINDKLLPDIEDIARYYPDYYQIGKGYGNLLSFGMFSLDNDDNRKHFAAGLLLEGEIQKTYDAEKIGLDIRHAWYQGREGLQKPLAQASKPAPGKEEAYSWIKAPRYGNKAFEGGPLARIQ